MTKQEKILLEQPEKKAVVLKILEMLNGENYNDAKEILDLSSYFVRDNSYIDFELAKDRINNVVEGD